MEAGVSDHVRALRRLSAAELGCDLRDHPTLYGSAAVGCIDAATGIREGSLGLRLVGRQSDELQPATARAGDGRGTGWRRDLDLEVGLGRLSRPTCGPAKRK
jgi:hypothetical protein